MDTTNNNQRLRGSEVYATELKLIKSEDLKNEVIYLLDHYVQQSNFIKPASSTGKYHPPFARGDGGLVRHTKAIVKILTAIHLATPDWNIDWDVMYASAILHDCWKYVDGAKYTSKNHAVAGADTIGFRSTVIQDPVLKDRLQTVGKLVLTHMGRFGMDDFEESIDCLPDPLREGIRLLHHADIIASRTWYSIPEEVNLTDEEVDKFLKELEDYRAKDKK